MKAIVMGANGFVGRHLIKELTNNDYEIVAVVRSGCKHLDALQSYSNIKIYYSNLSESSSISNIIKEDCRGSVFYDLAWDGHFGDKRKEYNRQLQNAINTVNLAVAASELGCRSFVVSGSVTQLMFRDYLRENNIEPDPVSCYPIGRLSAEAMLKCVCPQIGIELRWAYISNFYGEDDETTNIINYVVGSYLRNEMPILTRGNQFADFLYVDDVAKALRVFGEMKDYSGSAYIGYGNPRPLKEYFRIIYDYIMPSCPTGLGEKKFMGKSIDYSLIDYKWFSERTQFRPSISFEEGIKRLIEFRKDREENV